MTLCENATRPYEIRDSASIIASTSITCTLLVRPLPLGGKRPLLLINIIIRVSLVCILSGGSHGAKYNGTRCSGTEWNKDKQKCTSNAVYIQLFGRGVRL